MQSSLIMKRFINFILKQVYILIFILLSSIECYSISLDSISNRLEYQSQIYPQEKVHLSLNQSSFYVGDTIQFRAFVVDALTNKQVSYSKYIYVELINPFDEIVSRVKVRCTETLYIGYICLPSIMPDGIYTLCAYTKFMENQGPEYFCRKTVNIRSAGQSMNSFKIDYDVEADGVLVTVYNSEKSLHETSIVTRSRKEYKSKNSRFRIDRDEILSKPILVSQGDQSKFFMISDTCVVNLNFYPEGGYLVPNRQCLVAFKATNDLGIGVDVKGVIMHDGDTICPFQTAHKGMGVFWIMPRENTKYEAVINERKWDLPLSNKAATAIHIDNSRKNVVTAAVFGNVPTDGKLIVLSHGKLVFANKIDREKVVEFDREKFPTGISHFILLDETGVVMNERLAFIYPRAEDNIRYTVGKSTLKDSAYLKIKGALNTVSDVSIAITRSDYCSPDTVNSVLSNFLLQGELNGYIETPNYYFKDINRKTINDMDMLMLTHGWNRYEIRNVINGRFSEPNEFLEIGSVISGRVKSNWRNRPIRGAVVNVISPQLNYFQSTMTDEAGTFEFAGVDWADGTKFVLQSVDSKGNNKGDIVCEDDTFPSNRSVPIGNLVSNQDINNYDYLNEKLIQLKQLTVKHKKEVEQDVSILEVLGAKRLTEDDFNNYNITTYDEALRRFAGISIQNGKVVYVGTSSIAGKNNYVEFWIDGTKWTPSFEDDTDSSVFTISTPKDELSYSDQSQKKATLMTGGLIPKDSAIELYVNNISLLDELEGSYPFHIISEIDYLRPSVALIMSTSAAHNGGAIVLTTKKGKSRESFKYDGVKVISPLGFQRPCEIYHCRMPYEIIDASENQLKTIKWLPNVILGEQGFNVLISKGSSNLYFNIQGVTDNGIPVVIQKSLHDLVNE